jgi:hypothetical protein
MLISVDIYPMEVCMSFHVSSVPAEIAREVRETLKAPEYGHPAHVDIARSYGPCRSCLRTFVTGQEKRTLFTFNPFSRGVPAPGPVFIHTDECIPFDGKGFPPMLRELPLLFEPVNESGLAVERIQPKPDAIEQVITAVFDRTEVAAIVVRNAEVGCFIARIEQSAA